MTDLIERRDCRGHAVLLVVILLSFALLFAFVMFDIGGSREFSKNCAGSVVRAIDGTLHCLKTTP